MAAELLSLMVKSIALARRTVAPSKRAPTLVISALSTAESFPDDSPPHLGHFT
jgi:hypothetical protein